MLLKQLNRKIVGPHRRGVSNFFFFTNDASVQFRSTRATTTTRRRKEERESGRVQQQSRSRCSLSASMSGESMSSGPTTQALDIWTNVEAVCFDVDSTVCPSEGIDDLAAFLGKGEEVAQFTAQAMTGTMPFEVALAERLKIIQPSVGDIETFLAEHPPLLTPGVKDLVESLHQKGKKVYLVSGGFRLMIEPVAEQLGIPRENIFANTILFSDDSSRAYQGFDASEFTSKAGGKARAAKHIKSLTNAKLLAMIGDGATDLEARQEGGADIFVGYGGIVAREKVLAQADWAVWDFKELRDAL